MSLSSWESSVIRTPSLRVTGDDTVTATNTVERDCTDVRQVYLTDAPGERRVCLLGVERVDLPGETQRVTISADPRLLTRFDGDTGRWEIAQGDHQIVTRPQPRQPFSIQPSTCLLSLHALRPHSRVTRSLKRRPSTAAERRSRFMHPAQASAAARSSAALLPS
jgi:Fibronectin type III-like domain